MRVAACLLTAAFTLAGTVAGPVLAAPAAHAAPAAGVYTASQDTSRDNWDPAEPSLSPATMQGGGFGQLFATQLDGQVYAQPLVIDNAAAGTSSVIVATEKDQVYSLDGQTGAVNWSLSLGQPWPSSVVGCKDLAPYIGVTSTPVYDQATGTMYVAAVVGNAQNENQPSIDLFAIGAASGTILWKVPVKGSPVNNPTQVFNPLTERQRASLLLLDGSVYLAFASYCDYAPWTGYVAGVNTTSKAETLWSAEAGLADAEGGIWMSGAGLMSDGPGRIFLVTGNGVAPAPGKGTAPPAELGDSVVRLGVQPGGTLAAQDFFSPDNAPQLDVADGDLGSGGVVALPFGTSTYPNLLVAGGKDGRVWLLNRDALGGRDNNPYHVDNPVSVSGPYGGQWGHPAAFAGANGADYVYFVGADDNLRALQFQAANPAAPALVDVANSASPLAYTSGSPVVTSNGADPNSAVIWEITADNESGVNGRLEAFGALPQGSQLPELWSAPIGTATKFSSPATADGRVYVGTRDGKLFGFGSPHTAPLTAPPTDFGQVAVGTPAAPRTVTVTAASDVTVTGVSASPAAGPFAVGAPSQAGTPVTLPVTLSAGQTLDIPVTYTPAGPGGSTGAVVLSTSTPNFAAVTFPLAGDGTQPGLYSPTATLAYGTVPVGLSIPRQVNIVNGGTVPETVSQVTVSASQFTVTGVTAGQTTIQPGASVPVTVTFTPTAAAATPATLTVASPDGTAAVALTGAGKAGQGTLTPSATAVSFGNVRLGQFAAQGVTFTNTGNLPVTITKFGAPTVPFGTPAPVPAGLAVDPGYDITLPVTFTPQGTGTMAGTYRLSYTDGKQQRSLVIPVHGSGTAPAAGVAVPSPGGGWTLNGSARMSGTTLRLTPPAKNQAGSAVYYQPLPSNGLHAKFTARLSGGTGADGMTFALLNPAARVSSLGSGAGNLGFGGLSGAAVVLGTHQDPGDPSGNFVGIATGVKNGHLVFAATSTKVPNLRSGTPVIGVTVASGKITVTVNGTRYLAAGVKLPSTVLAAFTAATSRLTDIHTASGVSLSSGTVTVPPPGGGWSYNGAAQLTGSATALTQAAGNQAGSVVYPRAVASNGLHARFNIAIGGGTGADGMTFALLNPGAKATALGAKGQGLGFLGLSGLAITFCTYQLSGNPSANFAALATSGSGKLKYLARAVEIGQLRSGTHDVSVTVRGSAVIVDLDGQQVLQLAWSLPSSVVLGYTGGTDAGTDAHVVRNAAIGAAGFK